METASSTAATRGGSLQKERRAVSDSKNAGDATDYVDLEQLKLNRTDEEKIYENGRELDGFSNGELLQQRILTVSKQKGELQQLEIELRAQMIARHEIMEIQSNFGSQFTEYANVAARMQEQLHEKDISIREAERQLEEKDKEAWATFRRERDHSEAERSQNIHKISQLQEHIQEKERQFTELQEQNRIAQETLMYKDEY